MKFLKLQTFYYLCNRIHAVSPASTDLILYSELQSRKPKLSSLPSANASPTQFRSSRTKHREPSKEEQAELEITKAMEAIEQAKKSVASDK